MKYLDLAADQSASLAAGKVVEVWERMEPQPPEDATEVFVWFAGDLRNAPNGCSEDGVYFVTRRGLRYLGPAPHPPGTRAIASVYRDEIDGAVNLISTTTRPERRGDEWGFVTGWAQDKGVK